MPPVSPLAPTDFPALPKLAGVTLSTRACNIRYKNRDDVLWAAFAPGTQAAGVFTRSLTAAAPVLWCRSARFEDARALVVNAGNANAFTGEEGIRSVRRTAAAAARSVNASADQVFVASTGVIGEPLPDEKITAALPELAAQATGEAWGAAARTIMTTDTFPKCATRTVELGDAQVTLNGIAKGSGMIAPDMATLLAFVFTDAAIPAPVLQIFLNDANAVSFNAITVDGDTSTNDTLLAFATGQVPHTPVVSAEDTHVQAFRAAFRDVLTELALWVVKDGEGASKFITVDVKGATDDRAAKAIAFTIANSPLVKTAIAGEDANWGRIVAAAGRAGEALEQEKLTVSVGGVTIAANGARVDGYDEAPVAAHMKGTDIRIGLDLGLGEGRATVYTCDLTHGYIDINGSYRS